MQNGEIAGGHALLKQGAANWDTGAAQHRLDVDNLALALRRQGTGWQLDVPQLRLSTDGRLAAGHAFRPVAAGKYRVHGAGAE